MMMNKKSAQTDFKSMKIKHIFLSQTLIITCKSATKGTRRLLPLTARAASYTN